MVQKLQHQGLRVRIEWQGKKAPTEVELSGAKEAIDSTKFWPASIACEALGTVDALEVLACLADPDMESVVINGIEARVVEDATGGYCFIPVVEVDGVEVLDSGSSSWLPGGPCVMEQFEQICRYRDLYWVEASGDSESRCVAVGRFDDLIKGVSAAVEASLYFSIDAAGVVTCELDEGPQEE
jgi:hypothetical protein